MSKQYTAQIWFISRYQDRSYSWSTKQCKHAMECIGLTMTPLFEGCTELQKVVISGTREQMITQRNDISDRLRSVSGGGIHPAFELLDSDGNKIKRNRTK